MEILVAVDRSDESWNALDHALDVATDLDAEVTVVHAVDDGDVSDDAVLEEATDRASDRGLSVETSLLHGDPVETISTYADESDTDVIYVGHRGLSGKGREIPADDRGDLGSVAKGLVTRTTTPVTVFDRDQ